MMNFKEDSTWIVLSVINKNRLFKINSLEAKGVIYQIDNNDFETVKFNTIDSTIIFPGFKTKRIKYKFKIFNDSIRLELDTHKKPPINSKFKFKTDNYELKIKEEDTSMIEFDIYKRNQLNNIYNGIYKIESNIKKTEIILKSKSTTIKLKSVKGLIDEVIEGKSSPPNIVY